MLLNISFHFDFFPLLIVVAIAWLTPILLSIFKLKKIPVVIIEIFMGFIAGQYIFGSFGEESRMILDFLALFGFLFLMFLGGLEIDVDQLVASLPRKQITVSRFLRNPLLVGITQFLLAIILSYVATMALDQMVDIPNIWYFSLMMVTTSVAIVLPVLKDRGEIANRFGQMIVIAAAIADILSIILFTFTAFIIKNGFHYKLLYIIALFILFLISYFIINKIKNIKNFKRLSYQLSQAASQIRIRSAIVVIFVFVVVSQYIGEEVVLLGAFLSGLLLSSMLHRERSLMLIKLDGMGFGFFIPFFFIMVGANFDPHAFAEFDPSFIGFLLALLVSLFAIKVIPSLLWKRLFGTKKAIAGGFLISSRLSLIIAASAIGLDLGVISSDINSSIIIMAVITCFLSPIIYNWLSPSSITEGNKTIIIGGSSTGVLLARRLHLHGKKAVIIENNQERFQEIIGKGILSIYADGSKPKPFRNLKIKPNNYVVIETGNDAINLSISRMLRKEFQHEKIISRISRFSLKVKYEQLGIETIDETQILATAIENLIIRPTTYHSLVESFENFSVEEISIKNKDIDGKQVKEIPFNKNAILMMHKRENNFIIPHGETYLKRGDILLIFGTNTAFEDIRHIIG